MTEMCGSGLEQNDFYSLRLKFTVRRHKFNKFLPTYITLSEMRLVAEDGNTQRLVDAGRKHATIGGCGTERRNDWWMRVAYGREHATFTG